MSDSNLNLQDVLNTVDKLTLPFKAARTGSQELSAAVNKSREALKALSVAGTRLTSIGNLTSSLRNLDNQLDSARLRAQMMTLELTNGEAPTKEQTQAVEEQWRSVSRLEKQHQDETVQLGTQRAELYRMGISAQDSAGATAQIRTQSALLNAELAEQETRLQRVGDQQRKLTAARERHGKVLELKERVADVAGASKDAGLSIGAPVMSAVKQYASVETAMQGVAKQVPGLYDGSGKRTDRYSELQNDIKAGSEKFPLPDGAAGYAALVETGARSGVGQDAHSWEQQKAELLTFASTLAKASVAFELPADGLALNLTHIASLYKIPVNQIEQLGDVINFVDDNATAKGADIINVLQGMNNVAGKLDVDKAAALGSTLLSLGATPEMAANTANSMVGKLSTASQQDSQFQRGLSSLNVKPKALEQAMATDAMGALREVLALTSRLPEDKRINVMAQLFGKEASGDAANLAGNLSELDRQLALVKGNATSGSMQKESDINADSLSAQWILANTGVNNMMSGFGETLRAPLMEMMSTIRAITAAIQQWVMENPQLAGTLMKIAAAIAVVLAGAGALGMAVISVLSPLLLFRGEMSGLASAIGFVMNPLAAGSSLLSTVGSVFSWVATGPMAMLRLAISGITAGLGLLFSPVGLVVAALASVALVVWKYWEPISAFLGGVVAGFTAAAAPILDAFSPLLPVFQWIGETVQGLFGWFDNLLTPVKLTATELSNAASMGQTFGQALADGLNIVLFPLQTLMSGVDWLLKKMGLIKDESAALPKISDITPPETYSAYGTDSSYKKGYSLYGIDAYDAGGYIPSGSVGIVGEYGPELVNGPANILGRHDTASLAVATALAYEKLPPLPDVLPGTRHAFSQRSQPGTTDLLYPLSTRNLHDDVLMPGSESRLAMDSLTQTVTAAPLHPQSLPTSTYRTAAAPDTVKTVNTSTLAPLQAEINIYQQSGQDTNALVAEVMRQLDALQRAQAATRYSQFSDTGDYA